MSFSVVFDTFVYGLTGAIVAYVDAKLLDLGVVALDFWWHALYISPYRTIVKHQGGLNEQ